MQLDDLRCFPRGVRLLGEDRLDLCSQLFSPFDELRLSCLLSIEKNSGLDQLSRLERQNVYLRHATQQRQVHRMRDHWRRERADGEEFFVSDIALASASGRQLQAEAGIRMLDRADLARIRHQRRQTPNLVTSSFAFASLAKVSPDVMRLDVLGPHGAEGRLERGPFLAPIALRLLGLLLENLELVLRPKDRERRRWLAGLYELCPAAQPSGNGIQSSEPGCT
jgi:hypothetical protein